MDFPPPLRLRSTCAERAYENDAWVERIADDVIALLRPHGLDLELLVVYDRVTEMLHAVGYDGAPSRYFRTLKEEHAPDLSAPPTRVPTSASLAFRPRGTVLGGTRPPQGVAL